MEKNKYVLAVDFGGTFFKSAIVDQNCHILTGSYRIVRSKISKKEIAEYFISSIELAKAIVEKFDGMFIGVGLASPGPFDYKNATSYMKHKLKGIYRVNLKELLEKSGALDRLVFHCMHDGLAFLLGEYLSGTAGEYTNVACLTLGTGTGFSVMKNGMLCEDSKGSTAFSIYQNPLNGKSVEDYLSRRGIIKLYKQYTGNKTDFDVYDIQKSACEGNDPFALKTFEEVGCLIADATRDILKSEEIECLILGGQISKGYRLMEKSIKEGLSDVDSLQRIVVGKNLDFSAQLGVAYKTFLAEGIDSNASVVHYSGKL